MNSSKYHRRRRWNVFFSLIFLFLTACVNRFSLVKADSGWVQLSSPPSEEKAILSIADDYARFRYSSDRFDAEWFGNSDGDYMIYFHEHLWEEEDDYGWMHCGDETVIFHKTELGWIQTKDGKAVICVD